MTKIPTSEIKGWFPFASTYDWLLKRVPEGGTFVELGAWQGKSTSYMSDQIEELNRNVKFYTVDNFHDTGNKPVFLKNMEGRTNYELLNVDANKAAEQFEDGSIDIVFIDMEHDYDSVINDIKIWYPKVKKGGFVTGHDYNPKGWPGVCKAVHELIGGGCFTVMEGYTWVHRKITQRMPCDV